MPRYRLCTIVGASDPLGIIFQGIRTGSEPLRKEARPFGPALCQLLSNPAEEPTQASTNRRSHASLQSTCQPRALHMTRIASRTARACLGTASSTLCFCASDPRGIRPQGGHTGMKTEKSAATPPRFAEDPRTSCKCAARAMPFFAGHHRTTEAGPIRLSIASTPGACAWATPFCLVLAKTGDIILFFQFKHTDDLYESQYRRVFYSYYCRSE